MRHKLDLLGAALLSGSVTSLILLTTWGGNEYAWGSTTIVALAIVGWRCSPCSSGGRARVEEPILPLQLFRSSVFRVANAMGFTIGMAMFGAIVFIPLYLQLVYGPARRARVCACCL